MTMPNGDSTKMQNAYHRSKRLEEHQNELNLAVEKKSGLLSQDFKNTQSTYSIFKKYHL